MRDKFRPIDLGTIIKESSESIKRLNISLTRVPQERIATIKRAIYDANMELTIAHYSIGDDKETVKKSLLETIDAFNDGFVWLGFENHFGGYIFINWIVSLCVVCDIDAETFKKVTDVLKRDGANDKLLSKLIRHIQPDWPNSSDDVIQKDPYATIADAMNIDEVKNYLKNTWYKGHSDAWWHNIHKSTKVNRHFGYWAWETAALVKINGWDDLELKDMDYYPYDAVHW
jgi:hypothetical protein